MSRWKTRKKPKKKSSDELIKEYSKTDYGNTYHAPKVDGIPKYQSSFPIVDYKGLLPYIAQAKREGTKLCYQSRRNAGL